METGTQILIDRMKSHPEEFGERSSKWGRVWAFGMENLPEEDRKALMEANRLMRIEKFNVMVMATLAGEPETEEETLTVKADGRYAMGWHDPRTTLISGSNGTEPSAFGAVPVKAEGATVSYDTYTHKSYP